MSSLQEHNWNAGITLENLNAHEEKWCLEEPFAELKLDVEDFNSCMNMFGEVLVSLVFHSIYPKLDQASINSIFAVVQEKVDFLPAIFPQID